MAYRTAVYGPVRTVVWQGSAGNRRSYADQVALWEIALKSPAQAAYGPERRLNTWFFK